MDKKRKRMKIRRSKNTSQKTKKIYLENLVKYIDEHPDSYLVEIAQEFDCSECAIRKALKN